MQQSRFDHAAGQVIPAPCFQQIRALTRADVDDIMPVHHTSPRPSMTHLRQQGRAALSRESEFATRSPEVTARAHAAVAARHVRNASPLRTRSVLRDVRWRWTLNVLWTAARTDRNRWADPGDLNRCILSSRRRVG